jgi:signal transduction histidine kinase
MATPHEGKLRFKASARLQRLFGRDLLPDDSSAVEELVKNAYDSNATEVTITIVRSSPNNPGEIEIRDNGFGLSLRDFRRLWMTAGYSEKTGAPLPSTGRVPVGEKGIGRFSADKLGKQLTVITKPRAHAKALRVEFEWSRFEDRKKLLSDIPIPYNYVGDPLLPADLSGTILRIRGLRSAWDDKAIEELRRRLARLLNPYGRDSRFKINLIAPRQKLSGAIVPNEIRTADFEWEVIRDARGRTTVRRRRRLASDEGESRWTDWEPNPITELHKPTKEEEFGPVRGRFLYFINRPKRAQIGDAAPGVAVYRDGLRVEPAGSAGADWLGLVEKRAKRAGHMPLVPSRLFGFVEISRETNPRLQDATNRRSFVLGPPFAAFSLFLKNRLAELEAQVETEVAKPRWERSKQLKSQKLIQARHRTLSIMSVSLAHELRQPLQAIRTASENIVNYLSQEGLRIPQVDSAADVIGRNIDRINKHIQFLKDLGSGREETEPLEVSSVVGEVVEVFREYAAARNTALVQTEGKLSPLNFNRPIILATLTNLVLNALQAIEEGPDRERHEVRVSARDIEGRVQIQVDDDGPGIPEANRKRLFKRQTTTKAGGMGVGLIVWREAMQVFGGDLTCESFGKPTRFVITIPRGATNGENSIS